ncbi:hypothetical protein [Kineosporia sp. R_H_3]|uniref:hypothetical protein n=1 Tax=Kineosporia sp. R_H_3 TaxID=1961848 RepID=UPI000B4AA871|nr:hypothetical protein [Kineosporia sp. R_H_3]
MSGRSGRLSAPAGARPDPVPSSARPATADAVSSASDVGRSLRLPAFVGLSTLLGVGAHSLVEGSLPEPGLLVAAVVAVAVVALLGRRRERSFETIAALLVLGQAAVHAVLCLCHCTPGTAVATFVHTVLCPGDASTAAWATDPWLVAGSHGAHAATALAGADGAGYLAHLYPGHAMLIVHLLAAGVAAWWLRQGEAAVWAAAGWVWPALETLPVVRATVPGPAPRHWADATVRVLQDQVSAVRAHPRRGPPLRALVPNATAVA